MQPPSLALDVTHRLRTADGTVVIDPPGDGYGYWAGGPSAVFHDGTYWLAYRLRRPVTEGRGYANVVARSQDGVRFETVATVTSAQFECASLERPALVPLPGGGWRLYVSCSTLNSKHWWVEAIEAETVAGLSEGRRTIVLPGDAATAWKDVVVSHTAEHGWQMWACRHPLDGGDDAADRMDTWYATSADGLSWTFTDTPRSPPTPHPMTGTAAGGGWAASRPWTELDDALRRAGRRVGELGGTHRPGRGSDPAHFEPVPMEPIGGHLRAATGLRYSSFLADPGGGLRVYYETSRPDGAHDLRTEYVPRPSSDSQSE